MRLGSGGDGECIYDVEERDGGAGGKRSLSSRDFRQEAVNTRRMR